MKISPAKLAKLHEVFNSLDRDIEIGFATCLAEKLNLSFVEVLAAYEAWQIEE